MVEELATENEHLRDVLKVRDQFHVPDMHTYITEALRSAEATAANKEGGSYEVNEAALGSFVNVKEMVAEASSQIKKQANERKLE